MKRKSFQFVRALIAFCASMSLAVLFTPHINAQSAPPIKLPDGFEARVVASDLVFPTAMAFLPDGRMLITEKGGTVRVMQDGVVRAQLAIDLRDIVNENTDRGLLGVAVDPKFIENGYVYLLYSYDAPGKPKDTEEPCMGRLVRYTMRGNVLDKDSAFILLDDFSSDMINHSVGDVQFAADGNLFVAFGDGSISVDVKPFSYRALTTDTVNGKVIRIDRFGNGVKGNPFFDEANPRSARSRIWSLGHRNPFRFALHPTTGIPYVGNVGWNTYESIQRATAGANFGWPCIEGIVTRPEYANNPLCATNTLFTATPADYDYPHAGNNASLTVGDFNNNKNFPDEMRDDLFFADYSLQFIKRAALNKDGKIARIENFGSEVGEPVDLKFAPDGSLYYLSIYSGGLRQIRYTKKPLAEWKPLPLRDDIAKINGAYDGMPLRKDAMLTLSSANLPKDASSVWLVNKRDSTNASFQKSIATEISTTLKLQIPSEEMSPTQYIEVAHGVVLSNAQFSLDSARLFQSPEDGYIRTWLVTRSYLNRKIEDDALSGEAAFAPTLGDGRVQLMHSDSRLINLKPIMAPNEEGYAVGEMVAYAFVNIDVPSERDALLGMHSDESIAAWLNGQPVWKNNIKRDIQADIRDLDLPKVHLRQGTNTLLIKVAQTKASNATWAFKARILNPDGSVMRDVTSFLQ